MAISDPVYTNECGLPLNAIEWLEAHHASKVVEREQMVRDLRLKQESLVVDAGCGPGPWTPLLARAIGPRGTIIGVDISPEALMTARRRSIGQSYCEQVRYVCAALEELPLASGSADVIFSANVCQYLPRPVQTLAAMGHVLKDGGRLILKDIDFGTLLFRGIDPDLQRRVFNARARWEAERVECGFSFEDSWVGSKLADYLRAAGYSDVQVHKYRIARSHPMPDDFRYYLLGIAEWFVCEGAPLLAPTDARAWLQYFHETPRCVLDRESFYYAETEFVVSGVWHAPRS